MAEVGADGLDLGRQHDLMLVADRLRVIALQKSPQPLDDARVGVADVDATLRRVRRPIGVRRAAEAPAIFHPPARPIGLISAVGAHLAPELLLKAALGLAQAFRAAARHRPRVRRAPGLQTLPGLAQPTAATLRGREFRWQ